MDDTDAGIPTPPDAGEMEESIICPVEIEAELAPQEIIPEEMEDEVAPEFTEMLQPQVRKMYPTGNPDLKKCILNFPFRLVIQLHSEKLQVILILNFNI